MIRNPRHPRASSAQRCSSDDAQHMEQTLAAMPLDALRDAKQLTQSQMAQLLKISQGAVSKVERRNDMFISTLRNYVRAIGGDLQIRAIFPDGDVLIDQFKDIRQAEAVESAPNAQSGPGSNRVIEEGSAANFPVSSSGSAETGDPDPE
jgi:transcriptional regulator with XRE-family HTH domain